MRKLLRRPWKKPDPSVQREQAIQEARRRHEQLCQRAAALLEEFRAPEAELERAMYVVEELPPRIRRGLALASQARAAGDEPDARAYEQTVEFVADSLAAALPALKEVKILYDAALDSAEAAERAVGENASLLEEIQGGRDETIRSSDPEQAHPSPKFEQVRKEVDARYERALGEAEVARAAVRERLAELAGASGGDSAGDSPGPSPHEPGTG